MVNQLMIFMFVRLVVTVIYVVHVLRFTVECHMKHTYGKSLRKSVFIEFIREFEARMTKDLVLTINTQVQRNHYAYMHSQR